MMNRKKTVQYGFRAYGLMMATGIVLVFVPEGAMVRIGTLCGLPPFEVTPVFEYMGRGLAFVAFLFGLLMFYFACHLAEQARLIRFVGWGALGSVPVAVFIHAASETPLWWGVGDVVGLLILCALCLAAPEGEGAEEPGRGDRDASRRAAETAERAEEH